MSCGRCPTCSSKCSLFLPSSGFQDLFPWVCGTSYTTGHHLALVSQEHCPFVLQRSVFFLSSQAESFDHLLSDLHLNLGFLPRLLLLWFLCFFSLWVCSLSVSCWSGLCVTYFSSDFCLIFPVKGILCWGKMLPTSSEGPQARQGQRCKPSLSHSL